MLVAIFNVGYIRKYIVVSFLIVLIPSTIVYLANGINFVSINETIKFSGIEQNRILFFSDHHHLHMLSAIAIFKDNVYGCWSKMFRIKCKDPKYFRDKDNIYNNDDINLLDRDSKIRLNSLNGCSTSSSYLSATSF